MTERLVETACFHCDRRLLGPGEMFRCVTCGWWQCEECLEYEDSCPVLTGNLPEGFLKGPVGG